MGLGYVLPELLPHSGSSLSPSEKTWMINCSIYSYNVTQHLNGVVYSQWSLDKIFMVTIKFLPYSKTFTQKKTYITSDKHSTSRTPTYSLKSTLINGSKCCYLRDGRFWEVVKNCISNTCTLYKIIKTGPLFLEFNWLEKVLALIYYKT